MTPPIGRHHIPPVATTIVDHLPNEILLTIFSQINFADVQSALLSCRRFKELADDNMLRKLLFEKDFPNRRPFATRVGVSPSLRVFAWKRQYKCAVLAAKNVRAHRCSTFLFNEMGHRGRITCLEKIFLEDTGADEMKEFFISGSSDGLVQVRRKRGKLTDTVQQFSQCGDGVFVSRGDFLFLKDGTNIKVLQKNDLELFNEIGLLYSEFQTLPCGAGTIVEMIAEDNLFLVRSNNVLQAFVLEHGQFKQIVSHPNVHLMACRKKSIFAIGRSGELIVWKKDFKQPQILSLNDPSRSLPSRMHAEDGIVVAVTNQGAATAWTEREDGTFRESYFLDGIHARPVTASAFRTGFLILGTDNGSLEFLKFTKNDFRLFKCDYGGYPHRINTIWHDGRYLVTGSSNQTTRIWELDKTGSFQCIQTLRSVPSGVTAILKAEDQFVVGYENGKFEVWDFGPTLDQL